MLTLLQPSKIIPAKWMSSVEKKQIDTTKGIDWYMNYITDRIYIKGEEPKIKIKSMGNKVAILRAGTGSGKSALVAPSLYYTFFESNKKNIIITQPTIATATSIPMQILPYNSELKLGQNIGYQTGTISKKPIKGILFCTVGILLQHLITLTDEEFMKKYSFVLVDEVHNRSIETDSVLFYLKLFLSRNWDNPSCPFVILMSGTVDPVPLMNYFGCPSSSFVDIVGLSFPIEDNFAKFDVSNYVEYIADLIEHIHVNNMDDITKNNAYRDVLVFVQGNAQMTQIEEKVHYINSVILSKGIESAKKHSEEQQKKYAKPSTTGGKEKELLYILPIPLSSAHINKGSKEYMSLYSDPSILTVPIYEFKDGKITDKIISTEKISRRIMIGTNAIETGITIDTLGYCVDSGWVKESQFNPTLGCQLLIDKNVTRASAMQRRGRVGRKAPGKFYACYTKETFDSLPAYTFPDIIKEDITKFILSMIVTITETTLDEVKDTDNLDECFQMNQFDQKWYKLSSKKQFDASAIDFIQYPATDSMRYSLEKLYALGFIDHKYQPTAFGFYANKFRKLNLENIRMILAGFAHGANILDLITIASCLEVGFEIGIRRNKYTPRNPLELTPEESIYYNKLLFADEFVEYLFIWDDFMNAVENLGDLLEKNIKNNKKNIVTSTYLNTWCKENHFKLDGLLSVVEMRDEIITDMLTNGLNPYYNGLDIPRGTYNLVNILKRNLSEGMDEICKLKKSIYDGYRMNLCIWDDNIHLYKNIWNGIGIHITSDIIKPILPEERISTSTGKSWPNSIHKNGIPLVKKSDDTLSTEKSGSGEKSRNIDDKNSNLSKVNDLKDMIKQNRPQKIIVSEIKLAPKLSDNTMYELVGSDVCVLDGYVDVDMDFLLH